MTTIINASTVSGLVNSADTSGILQLQTASTAALTITAAQNVGIGVTAPAKPLSVYGGDGYIQMLNASTGTATGDGSFIGVEGGTTALRIVNQENDAISFSTNGLANERMRIDSSGRVGIGTTSPNANLQVSGAIQVTGTPSIGSTGVGVEIGYGLVNASEGAIQAYNRSGSAWINMAYSALAHKFLANNSEAMRIDSSGNFLVGQTSQTNNEKFGVTQSGASSFAAYFNASNGGYGSDMFRLRCARGSATNEYVFLSCVQVSSVVFQVQANGNVQNTNNSYGSLSDVKLKENIVDATPKLDSLMQVKVRNYNLKTDQTHKQIGVIAQELEQVFPAMVEETPDRDIDGNDLGTTTKAVKYSVFVPMLIKSIQELKAINDTQAETINALTARIVALEGA